MVLLSREEYQALSRELETHEDVARVARERGLDEGLLMVIYTQRVTRDATKRFYVVQNHAPRLLKQWEAGASYLDLAQEWRFPPVLMAQMIERQKNTPRKAFWDGFRNPAAIPDARIRREVNEVLAEDWIYSPRGGELQRERGVMGESRLAAWLNRFGLRFRTEKDLRGKFAKTPDALLDEPVLIDGQKVQWIESKANFGDDVELRRNVRKQLEPYVRMFGEGIVVYWYGHLRGAEGPPGIRITDGETFESLVPVPMGTPGGRGVPRPPMEPAPRSAPPTARPASGTAAPPPRRRARPPVDRSAYF
jgi:hypothetical protein